MSFDTLIPGTVSPDYINDLEKISKMSPQASNAIEVGSYAGRTTQVLRNLFPIVYAVDTWNDEVPAGGIGYGLPIKPKFASTIFQKNILSKYDNVKNITGKFPNDFPEEFKHNIGFVYFDKWVDDNEYQMFSEAWDLLIPGGILCGRTFSNWTDHVLISIRQLAYYHAVEILLTSNLEFFYLFKTV
jgi:SAM-dependent methyltransferase